MRGEGYLSCHCLSPARLWSEGERVKARRATARVVVSGVGLCPARLPCHGLIIVLFYDMTAGFCEALFAAAERGPGASSEDATAIAPRARAL
jgi:hypothetical protein